VPVVGCNLLAPRGGGGPRGRGRGVAGRGGREAARRRGGVYLSSTACSGRPGAAHCATVFLYDETLRFING